MRSPKKKNLQNYFLDDSKKKRSIKIFQPIYKILIIQKIMLSSSRGQGNFRRLEASRPRPRTSKCVLEAKDVLTVLMFNRFACFWSKSYQRGSLGKSHQNGEYLKQSIRKHCLPQKSNLQPLDYRSTVLPLELEKTSPSMLNFGYLNPATSLVSCMNCL